MSVEDQKVGQLLDALGTTVPLDQGDMPTDAVVILKVLKEDGSVSLIKGHSESVDWITVLGMLTAAQEIENSAYGYADDDD